MRTLSTADLECPSWMPTGPGTYPRFLATRVFDFPVHEHDITTPLGRETDDRGLAAEIALAEVEGSLGYIVGKKVGLPDEKRTRLDNPDVEVTTDSTTFIQLACGRIDPQVKTDSGAIAWIGDAELGERAARNLRFTM